MSGSPKRSADKEDPRLELQSALLSSKGQLTELAPGVMTRLQQLVADNPTLLPNLQPSMQLIFLSLHIQTRPKAPFVLWPETDLSGRAVLKHIEENLLPALCRDLHNEVRNEDFLYRLLNETLKHSPQFGRLVFKAGIPILELNAENLLQGFCQAVQEARLHHQHEQLSQLNRTLVSMVFEVLEKDDFRSAFHIVRGIETALSKLTGDIPTSATKSALRETLHSNSLLMQSLQTLKNSLSTNSDMLENIQAGLRVSSPDGTSPRETFRAELMKTLIVLGASDGPGFLETKVSTFFALLKQEGALARRFSIRGQGLAEAIVPLREEDIKMPAIEKSLIGYINLALADADKLPETIKPRRRPSVVIAGGRNRFADPRPLAKAGAGAATEARPQTNRYQRSFIWPAKVNRAQRTAMLACSRRAPRTASPAASSGKDLLARALSGQLPSSPANLTASPRASTGPATFRAAISGMLTPSCLGRDIDWKDNPLLAKP